MRRSVNEVAEGLRAYWRLTNSVNLGESERESVREKERQRYREGWAKRGKRGVHL